MEVLELQGIDLVINKIHKITKGLPKSIEIGLKKAGVFIKRESQKIVPVWRGYLKASAYVRVLQEKANAVVVVGYSSATKYAIYVHELTKKAHGKEFNLKYANQIAAHSKVHKRGAKAGQRYWDRKQYYRPRGENQQAKFLITPIQKNHAKILEIISTSIKDRLSIDIK